MDVDEKYRQRMEEGEGEVRRVERKQTQEKKDTREQKRQRVLGRRVRGAGCEHVNIYKYIREKNICVCIQSSSAS